MALTTTNLQIYYPFSNSSCYSGTGTTVTNLGLAGASYNGYVNADAIRASGGGTTPGVAPVYDAAQNGGIFKFGGNKSRITIPDGSVTRINASTYRTIQMWVLWNSLTATLGNGLNSAIAAPIFGKLSNNHGFDGYIAYAMNTGSLRITLNAAAEHIPATSSGVITTNQWYFLTFVVRTANIADNVKFYKEATQQSISPTRYGGSWSTSETNPLQLGTGFMNYSTATYGGVTAGAMESFNGWIGDFLMYDTILSDQQISDNFDATKSKYFGTPRTVKYYDGTTWQNSSDQKYWNGSAWVAWNNVASKRWNGTNWIDF